jgi:hypothetical protein
MKNPTVFFHFDCFAVVSFTLDLDETAVTPDTSSNVEGFFLTREDADAFIVRVEGERIAAHEAYCAKHFIHPCNRHISLVDYRTVALSQLSLHYLYELEDSIEKAARLQTQGIGIEGPHAT